MDGGASGRNSGKEIELKREKRMFRFRNKTERRQIESRFR